MFLEIASWALLVLFLAIIVWDIAIGKPSRFYTIKRGLNSIAKVFVGLGILLGLYVCIILTPFLLRFFNENMLDNVYGLNVSAIASYYWVCLVILFFIFLVTRVDKVNIFKLSGKELEWEKQKKEKERRETLETKGKFKSFFSKLRFKRN